MGLKARVVSRQGRCRLAAKLALLLGIAEPAATPPGLEQSQELGKRAGGSVQRVEALEHLMDKDSEALVDRRLLGDAENPCELVLERTRPVGVDVRRRQHHPVAALGQEWFQRGLIPGR